MSNINNKQDGFSTVELLVTVVTIGIIFSAFITTFTTIQNINKKASDIQKANIIAFEKLQQYENTEFADLPNSSQDGVWEEIEDFSDEIPGSVQPPRVGKIYVNTSSPTLKQIGVEVEYGDTATKQKISYVTFIQASGVGR